MTSVGSVSFQGAIPRAAGEMKPREWAKYLTREKEVKTELLKQMSKPIQMLDKMKNFVGEVPNIIITALGTGLVAPFFIKHNPLSKADEDTRTYSAWRQPVSAVLAVATQVSMVAPFNNLLTNMTNKGEFEFLDKGNKYNKSAYQDVDFLEKVIKKENPNLSKEAVTKLAKQRQYTQLEDMLESLYHDNTVKYSANGKPVSLNEKEVNELLEKTAKGMFEKAKEPQDKEIAEKLLAKIKESKTPNIKKIVEDLKFTEEQAGKFVYDVAQKHISTISSNIKNFKQGTGLVVSLAILPVTCILLNKIYPKFMDVFFPHLSKKKEDKPKEGSEDTFTKAVDGALSPRFQARKEVE